MTRMFLTNLVNSTVLKGKLRCTVLLCVMSYVAHLSSYLDPALGLFIMAAILLAPLPHLGWIQPSCLPPHCP